MKKLFLIIGSLICVALIVGAMYVVLSLGLGIYVAYMGNTHMRVEHERRVQQQAQQQQDQAQRNIALLEGNANQGSEQSKKKFDELDGKPPSLFIDPEGYHTEDNWLAATISREISSMAFIAAHSASPLPDFKITAKVDPDKPLVHVEVAGFDPAKPNAQVIDLTPTFAWDPEGYTPLARLLLGNTAGSPPVPDTDATDVLGHLLNPTGSAIALEDVRLSSDLLHHPASWQDHEAAALVLVTLALREAAGAYLDNRMLLNRATAQLAIAQALRGNHSPTLPGMIADAAIRTLAGRELDALAHLKTIETLPNLPDSAKSWIEALRLFATTDWRVAEVTTASPLLVKIAWFRALSWDLNTELAAQRLQKVVPLSLVTQGSNEKKVNPETLVPDWGRYAGTSPFADLSGDDPQNGKYRLDLEFHDLDESLQAEGFPPLDLAKLPAILSQDETDTISRDDFGKTIVHVVGPATFAAAARRHLFLAIPSNDPIPNSSQDPAQAQNLFTKYDKLFQGVRDYDLARLHYGFDIGTGDAQQSADWVAAKKKWRMWEVPCGLVPGPGGELVGAFYKRAIPFGTVYEPSLRFDYIRAIDAKPQPPADLVELERIRKLPLNEQGPALLAYEQKQNARIWAQEPKGPTPFEKKLLTLNPDLYLLATDHVPTDKFLSVAKRFLDYNMSDIGSIENLDAEHLSDTDREMIYRKSAEFAPLYCFTLGEFLRAEGKEDEAAVADRKGLAGSDNKNAVISFCSHLLQYDLERGLTDEALRIGKLAGDSGIAPYIYFDSLEGTGHLDEAEDCAKNIEASYDDTSPQIILYVGHPDHFPGKREAEQKRIFSNGPVKVDITSFSSPPTKGWKINLPPNDSHTTMQMKSTHLRADDIIVALDGYRTDTAMQYFYVRSLSRNPIMDFIVWRDGRYVEVKVWVSNRRLGLPLADFVTN